MDSITIFIIIVGVLFTSFLFFVEDAFEKLIDRVLSLVGLRSHCGPLHVTAKKENKSIVLTILNEGSSPAKFATIQGKDTSGNLVYPIPYLQGEQWKDCSGEKAQSQLRKDFVKQKLATQCSKTIYLKQSELVDCSLDSLELLDALGGKWPVTSE